jgi:hypothetical protein
MSYRYPIPVERTLTYTVEGKASATAEVPIFDDAPFEE